ncbi:ATP-binding cassette domain-containing protein [Amycolatopsis sp. H20-H5]|uniref:ATP-binding cassette domain-containing protein n=1 Tax=Amycolatopsis sp. H20-H5 TaxID=3046309 RepID=UPI002DC00467|nr:ATP-binding cassette domain-containing protein [Amycolatopsis sp. H20-H5]MEC3974543.1 ATP-binding cassette domain-containing protein [Amycolatopsis sp. H20-H5]
MLRLSGVGKRYGKGELVLDGVDLEILPGRVLGVLGANGSGKSTLLRILAALSRPSVGSVAGRPTVGYLPDRFPAGQRMSAQAYLRHMGRLRGLDDLSTGDALLERLALVGGVRTPLRQLSKGNAQKVGLAQAVLARPELLVLDEPWSGLDVGTHGVLGELVAETKARGASVVFTDHRPTVVHEHADEVYRIDKGRLSAPEHVDGPEPRTRIVLHGPGEGDWHAEPDVRRALASDSHIELTVDTGRADAVLLLALTRGWSVREVAPCSP